MASRTTFNIFDSRVGAARASEYSNIAVNDFCIDNFKQCTLGFKSNATKVKGDVNVNSGSHDSTINISNSDVLIINSETPNNESIIKYREKKEKPPTDSTLHLKDGQDQKPSTSAESENIIPENSKLKEIDKWNKFNLTSMRTLESDTGSGITESSQQLVNATNIICPYAEYPTFTSNMEYHTELINLQKKNLKSEHEIKLNQQIEQHELRLKQQTEEHERRLKQQMKEHDHRLLQQTEEHELQKEILKTELNTRRNGRYKFIECCCTLL